jgi:hypothetical protein
MKYLSFIFIVINLFAMPKWYGAIVNENKSIYIGYGEGKSEKEAKQNALDDIASQISVNINYSFKKEVNLSSKKYQKNISQKSIQKARANLNDWELLRLEKEKDKFYVAIKYENIPSLDKFAKKTKLKKDDIIYSIKKDFGKSLGLELIRKDKRWYIKYKDIAQLLETKDFERFFITKENKALYFALNRNILYDGDEFYFKLKSKESGFVTIFDVYEDGTVAILYKNVKVSKNKYKNIPDIKSEFIPIAGLLNNKETIDLYIALFSKKKIILDEFAMADSEFITEERYKNFDELIRFLKNKTFSSIKVIVKSRN